MNGSQVPLAFVTPGKNAVIKDIVGGYKLRKRLTDMGFVKSVNLKLLKNDNGPIIVMLGESKVALGFGMAQKIMVEELN
ncbi:MAG: ferrous iron transport protein A [Firmicutes bacterium]|nr:ferrous iron transport protein A [Bacillota bacterium]